MRAWGGTERQRVGRSGGRRRRIEGQAAALSGSRWRRIEGQAAALPGSRWRRSEGQAAALPGSRWRRIEGQAAAELVALLPLAALLLAGAWQLVVAGHASWAAGAAARAAARASAVGADARAAARAQLPERLEHGLRVRERGSGSVEVALRIPPVLGLPVLGETTATAHFRPQR